jgi:EPS-associated MarR family transcriptional regulator
MHLITDDVQYRLLKYFAEHPQASQRQVARELAISLGKVNYCLRALTEKGWVKVRNFTNSQDKRAYAYILTSEGLEEKFRLTRAFLFRKMSEFDDLASEIKSLTAEVDELKRERS